MYQKKCVICNKDFEARVPHKITCSAKCRKKHQANLSYNFYLNKKENGIEKICLTCGIVFHSEREEAKYCSLQCNRSGSNFKKERKIIFCLNCNKEVEVLKDNPRNTRFCCIGCSNTYFKSHDDIIKVCENCGNKFIVEYKNRNKHKYFCSKKCANTGENNSMYGLTGSLSPAFGQIPWIKGKTIETDEKVAELGRKVSVTLKEQFTSGERNHFGENNPMFGKHHSVESREQISRVRSERIVNGDYASWFDKGNIFSIKMKSDISYRSSWEKIAIEYLDKNEDIVGFLHEPFSLKYLFEGLEKNYIPDFFIEYKSGIKKVIEIKPKCFVEYEINQFKFQAAKDYCQEKGYVFEIWTEEDIKKLL